MLRGEKSAHFPVPSARHAWWTRSRHPQWVIVLILIMLLSRRSTSTAIGLLEDAVLDQRVGTT